jgi:hypothetical protein
MPFWCVKRAWKMVATNPSIKRPVFLRKVLTMAGDEVGYALISTLHGNERQAAVGNKNLSGVNDSPEFIEQK